MLAGKNAKALAHASSVKVIADIGCSNLACMMDGTRIASWSKCVLRSHRNPLTHELNRGAGTIPIGQPREELSSRKMCGHRN